MTGHHAVWIHSQEEARRLMGQIGADAGAYPYLVPKAVHRCIKLKKVSNRAATIIKQEMLSKGGEAAVSRETIMGDGETDVLLMGTLKQYRLLVQKLKMQPFGLPVLAREIEMILDSAEPCQRTLELPRGRQVELGRGTLIMGILNVTPDSFSDGGRYFDAAAAVERARQMKAEGADIIDVGGVSSRPGAELAAEEEELRRVLPVVKALQDEDLIISVDTFRANVARACLEAGADIINDIGRLQLDRGLLPVLVESGAPVIMMHNRLQFNQGKAYEDLVSDIIAELRESMEQAITAGVKEDRIILDPGIGFGKTPAQSRTLIKRLREFTSLGKPLLIGASRKSFIGQTLDLDVNQRMEGSLAVLAMAIDNGVDIIRVHDVKESKRAARMVDAVRNEDG